MTAAAGAFAIARDAGLGVVPHVGELAGPEEVRAAIELGVDRIQHGVRAVEDPHVLDLLAERHQGVDVVAGVEARGFIIGAPLAQRMGVGFVPIRKKGKLPGDVVSASYDLEYGSATIEVQTDAVTPGANVLVVDDVLATGGTAVAACELIEKVGGRVACLDVLVELAFLPGRARLDRWELHTGLVVN